jgi:hypothetical protein
MRDQLAEYLRFALEWIDAVPDDVASRLPAMPGFDRDAAEAALETHRSFGVATEEKIICVANRWAKAPGFMEFERTDFLECVREILSLSETA